MSRNHCKIISNIREEFILAYIAHEEKLRQRKLHVKQIIQENNLLLKIYKKGLADNENEVTTTNYISSKAELIVSILEAMNLQAPPYQISANPYVKISVEDHEQISLVKEDTLNPVWNEDFVL